MHILFDEIVEPMPRELGSGSIMPYIVAAALVLAVAVGVFFIVKTIRKK